MAESSVSPRHQVPKIAQAVKSFLDGEEPTHYDQIPIEDLRGQGTVDVVYNPGSKMDAAQMPHREPSVMIPFPERVVEWILLTKDAVLMDTRGLQFGKSAVPAGLRQKLHDPMRFARKFHMDICGLGKGFATVPFELSTRHMISYKFSLMDTAHQKQTHHLSEEMAHLEMKLISRDGLDNKVGISRTSHSEGCIAYINRIRSKWAMHTGLPEFSLDVIGTQTERPMVMRLDKGQRVTYSNIENQEFLWYEGSAISLYYDLTLGTVSCAPSSVANQVYIEMEVFYNLSRMEECEELAYARPMITFIRKIHTSESGRAFKVAVMKSMETTLILRSDIVGTDKIHWLPIVHQLSSHISLWKGIEPTEQELIAAADTLLNGGNSGLFHPDLQESLEIAANVGGLAAQELSSLHKACFFAYADEDAGLKKYIKRTCTKRVVSEDAASKLVNSFRRKFCAGYGRVHGVLPPFEADKKVKGLLLEMASREDWGTIESWALHNWETVELGKAIDGEVPTDPLSYAKDKAACREQPIMSAGCTINEIEGVLTTVDINEDCTLEPIEPRSRIPKVTIHLEGETALEGKYPTKLAGKAGEQKEELRLFGIGTVKNKAGCSIMAEKDKKVLAYLSGNLMTPTSKARQKMLHESSQTLMRDDVRAYMADFEGHNQNMQDGCCSALAAEFAKVQGSGDGQNHTRLFGVIDVFYIKEYEDEVYLIQGQYGGIEGWQNPFWTAMSSVIIDSARDDSPLTILSDLVYSDDVSALVEQSQDQEMLVQDFFTHMAKHAEKMGHKLKMSQCAYSDKRVTMLRIHQYAGRRADSTLKRLCSVSSMSESNFHSETQEISSISSSTTSALEQSNHPFSTQYLKHSHAFTLVRTSFLSTLSRVSSASALEYSKFSPQAQSSMCLRTRSWLEEAAKKRDASWIAKEIKHLSQVDKTKKHDAIDRVRRSLGSMVQLGLAVDSKEATEFIIAEDIIRGDPRKGKCSYALLVYIACIYSPEQFGGRGMEMGLYQMLSGHSVSVTRVADAMSIMMMIAGGTGSTVSKLLSKVFGPGPPCTDLIGERSCLSSHFPARRGIRTVSSLVESRISSALSNLKYKACYKGLIESQFEEDEMKAVLLSLFRGSLHCRIASVFTEGSPVRDMKSLVSKVQTSRGLFGKSGHRGRFSERIMKLNRTTIKIVLSDRDTFGLKFPIRADPVSFFTDRRSIMFPNITFVPISEPTMEGVTIWDTSDNPAVVASRVPPMTVRQGVGRYREPDVAAQSLYKGIREFTYLHFAGRHSSRIFKLATDTRWLVSVSGYGKTVTDYVRSCSVYKAFKYILSMYGLNQAERIYEMGELNLGGNVLHRLSGDLFRPTVALHVLPNVLTGVTAAMVQSWVASQGMEDGNINFSLLEKRAKLAYAVREMYTDTFPDLLGISLSASSTFSDVRIDWSGGSSALEDVTAARPVECQISNGDFLRMKIKGRMRCGHDDSEESGLLANLDIYEADEQDHEFVIVRECAAYLTKMYEEGLVLYPSKGSVKVWEPFFRRTRNFNPEWQLASGETLDENAVRLHEVAMSLLSRTEPELEAALRPDPGSELTERVVRGIRFTLTNASEFSKIIHECCDDVRERRLHAATVLESVTAVIQGELDSESIRLRKDEMSSHILDYIVLNLLSKFKVQQGRIQVDQEALHSAICLANVTEFAAKLSGTRHHDAVVLLSILPGYWRSTEAIMMSARRMNNHASRIRPAELEVYPNFPFSQADSEAMLEVPDVPEDFAYFITPALDASAFSKDLFNSAKRTSDTCSKVYAPIDSLASPTGSDSYVAQLGLFRAIKSKFPSLSSTNFGDFCAGRGDGKLASIVSGLNCTSYSRSDLFTALNRADGVTICKDYDIGDVRFIATSMRHTWVHFDISYISSSTGTGSQGKSEITENIITSINSSKLATLRLNSVSASDLEQLMKRIKDNKEISIAFSQDCKFCPYQFYLVVSESEKTRLLVEHQVTYSLSSAFKSLVLSYSRLVSWINFSTTDHDSRFNSTMSILGELPSMLSVMEGETTMDYIAQEIYCSDELRVYSEFMSDVPLPDIQWKFASWVGNIGETFYREPDLGLYARVCVHDEGLKSDSKQVNTWDEQRDQISKFRESPAGPKGKLPHVDLWSLPAEDCMLLSRRHPNRLVRRVSAALVTLKEVYKGKGPSALKKIATKIVSTSDRRAHYGNSRMKAMRRALECTAYAVLKRSRDKVYSMLIRSILGRAGYDADDIRLISEFRRMGTVYDTWIDEDVPIVVSSSFLKRFETAAVIPSTSYPIKSEFDNLRMVMEDVEMSQDEVAEFFSTAFGSIQKALVGSLDSGDTEIVTGYGPLDSEPGVGNIGQSASLGLLNLGGELNIQDRLLDMMESAFGDIDLDVGECSLDELNAFVAEHRT